MLPTQTPPPEPTINGIGVGDFIRQLWDNLADNLYQTGSALVVAAAAFFILKKFSVPMFLTLTSTFGAFWAGWLGYGVVSRDARPLFPGGFQATDPWKIFVEDGNEGTFFVLCLVILAVFVWIWKLGMSLALKIGIVISLLFGVSFFFNFLDGFRLPRG